MSRGWIYPFAAAVVCGGAAQAHHSIAAVYDTSHPVTVDGRVSEFLFINPHPVLVVSVANEGGTAQAWRLELDNRSELVEIGVDLGTFKPGDRVIATGSAGRKAGSQSMYAMRIERPVDGLLYEQIGYSPRINHPRAY